MKNYFALYGNVFLDKNSNNDFIDDLFSWQDSVTECTVRISMYIPVVSVPVNSLIPTMHRVPN